MKDTRPTDSFALLDRQNVLLGELETQKGVKAKLRFLHQYREYFVLTHTLTSGPEPKPEILVLVGLQDLNGNPVNQRWSECPLLCRFPSFEAVEAFKMALEAFEIRFS